MTKLMVPVSGDRLRSMFYGSRIYDAWLGSHAPRTLDGLDFDLSAALRATWYAEQLEPPGTIAEDGGRFRWIADATDRGDTPWPALLDWLERHDRWDAATWRPEVLGERVSRWLCSYDKVTRGLDEPSRTIWARAIRRNVRHLNIAPVSAADDWRQFYTCFGGLVSAFAIPEFENRLAKWLNALGDLVDRQILADGGHIERSPAITLAVLSILIDIRGILMSRHIEPPTGLISAIDRMVPFIKCLRHGDGGFGLFAGTAAHTGPLIDQILDLSEAKGRASASAPYSGFHRLRAGKTTLLLDCGETRVVDPQTNAPGSFELSIDKTRLISNCGSRLAADSARDTWQTALASTAAHSTMVMDNKNCKPVSAAKIERREQDGARLVEATHDGYADEFSATHRRSIFLDADGTDVRGEDVIEGERSTPFSIRFHLHPDVNASMVAGGGEVILKPRKGRGWQFRTHHPVMLEDSVNFFDGRQHRSKQIVILGNHEPPRSIVKWRINTTS